MILVIVVLITHVVSENSWVSQWREAKAQDSLDSFQICFIMTVHRGICSNKPAIATDHVVLPFYLQSCLWVSQFVCKW